MRQDIEMIAWCTVVSNESRYGSDNRTVVSFLRFPLCNVVRDTLASINDYSEIVSRRDTIKRNALVCVAHLCLHAYSVELQ